MAITADLILANFDPRFSHVARNSECWEIRPHTLLGTRRLKDKNLAARMASRCVNGNAQAILENDKSF
jgi:hypothetical protein